MEIKQLQSLVAISEHGTFSGAAKALDTVQSNISAHIARLEKELGTVLVDRASGTLTDEGEMVLTRARRILHEMEDIDADIHSLGEEAIGDCRIGTLGTTARWLMPPLLNSLTRHHPGVRTTIIEGATSALLLRLASGEVDAAIVHFPIQDPSLDVTELFAEELLLLAPTKHVLAERESITLEELSEFPLLLAPRGTAQRRIIDRAAATRGVALRSQAEIDGVRLMASLVFEGFGPAIVPASAAPGWLKGEFVRISVPDLPRRVVGWVQRERPRPNRATLAVRDRAIDVVGRHAPRQPGITLQIAPHLSKGLRHHPSV
jgi:LysR family hydrogen peroxide-inducible transcriptional activator